MVGEGAREGGIVTCYFTLSQKGEGAVERELYS